MFNLATAALQTIPLFRAPIASKDESVETRKARRALPVGQCMPWDPEDSFMQRLQPLVAQ